MIHVSVPKHEVLNKGDAKKLLIKYGVTPKRLPKILAGDQALKGMDDVKVGDIIKITRKSPTAGESVYYRVVIEK